MNWGFPENVSTFGEGIDATFGAIFYATALAFLIVQGILVYCIIRYRHRPGRKAIPIHGNLRLEVLWTIVPAIGVFIIAFLSTCVWLDMKLPSRFPPDMMEVAVHAQQFEWLVTYPGPDGVLGTEDDFTVRNHLSIPIGQPVRVILTAEDVIHSFFLPHFRVKQDAVPGMTIPIWFQATATGDYVLGCAELCGLGHYRMRGTVTVHTPEEFEAWEESERMAAQRSVGEPTTVVAR
jgi:cytochrome c oxidase subunit II